MFTKAFRSTHQALIPSLVTRKFSDAQGLSNPLAIS